MKAFFVDGIIQWFDAIRGAFICFTDILVVSSSTLENTVIFPLSGVAFMVADLQNVFLVNDLNSQENYIQKISKFTSLHRKCYLLASAPIHSEKEFSFIHNIQLRFIHTRLQLLPIHNAGEGVTGMLTIAKMLCNPAADILYKRLSKLISVTSDVIPAVLGRMGLTFHQSAVLQDGLGSLEAIARADLDQLLDCSIDVETARMILKFFENRQ